jgi:hypothetical protein
MTLLFNKALGDTTVAKSATKKKKAGSDPHWMEKAAEKMKKKGTKGSFGKATKKNIAKGRAAGGKMAQKANFANVAKKVNKKKK